MSKFTHLHVHSHYSLLNALPKIEDVVAYAKESGMQALALTDNANLYGAIEFYKECKKQEIKPIIGADFYVALRGRKDKESIDKSRTRLVLLVKDRTGYDNLIRLVTAAHLEGFYYKPRIDRELLEKYHEGLIAIVPSFSGDVANALGLSNFEKATEQIEWYRKIFGNENFYLEITHHPEIKGHEEKMEKIISFARKEKVQIVAAHDVYYIHPEDKRARDTLISIANTNFEDAIPESNEDFSFLSSEEAEKRFAATPDAIENCEKIVAACNLDLKLGTWVFPDYQVASGLSYDDELKRVTYEGLISHGVKETPEVLERIEYELTVIRNKGYAPYFLVVGDLLRHAKSAGILTTTRGSAGGSLVSYLNYITTLNPIEYGLPFERFLNPERPSAPDVDMDIADNRRDEMIEYAKSKYGLDKVAQIGTFGTMAARGSVRDVTRALGFPYALGDRIAKLIPMGQQGFPMTIDRALDETPELKDLYESDEAVEKIIDMARKIEGCARHMGIHAAGVVISPTPITDFTPLQYDPKGENKIITQYDMYNIEEAGLLKFDFLGITNLSILADSIDLVKKLRNITVDIEHIPVDDKKTFEMLARGETQGTFQLNGDGMTKWLIDLKPTVIHDLNVMVALYRPGPMNNINDYIARKHGKEKPKYLHPKMEKYLDKTFGVLVYQDDLLYTAIELAGYTWGEVDKFRKAVGKKIPEEMAKQHVAFVEGCIKHSGMTRELAEKIWKLFEPFQGYGFNKAHAASYGRVAYQTAYMKANFPAEYMAAVLTHTGGDTDEVAIYVNECKRMGIDILPPDINESFENFTVVRADVSELEKQAQTIDQVSQIARLKKEDHIRFGLVTIKNFGAGIAESIIAERKRGGAFTSLEDFLSRVKDKNMNKKSLESLIKAGALDSLMHDRKPEIKDATEWRGILLHSIDALLAWSKEHREVATQDSLFGDMSAHIAAIQLGRPSVMMSQADALLAEKELLGLYISGHPLETYRERLEKNSTKIDQIKNTKDKSEVLLGGIIESIRTIMTKDNDLMAFVRLADLTGSVEAVAFPKTYAEFKDILTAENCIVVKGKISTRNDQKSILIERVKVLE